MSDEYQIVSYPRSRVATFDVGKIGIKKHHIIGLVEVDVTEARKRISESIKTGKEISFTAWLIKCIGNTIASENYIQAINKGRNKQYVFNNVDISIPIEKEVQGVKVPLAALIKDVNNKDVSEIYNEIAKMKSTKIKNEEDYVLGKGNKKNLNRLFFNMPQVIRIAIWKRLLHNPIIRKRTMGTAILTNIGMVGNISGWIIPKSMHNLCIGIGSINKKPWVVKNEIVIREIMHMTILFDHDVVDGSPAAKFTGKLLLNIENGKWT